MSTRHRSGGGGTGPLLIVLGLGTVLAGLVYAFWDQIRSRLVEPEPERPVVVAPERPAEPEARKEPEVADARPPEPERAVTRPAAPKVEPSVLVRERREAQAFRGQAEDAYKALDFDRAATLFGREAAALRHDPDGAARAKDLATRAEVFRTLTKDIKPNPVANGELVTLLKHSGNDIKDVVLVDETDDAYKVSRQGMTFDVRRDLVRAVERMSPEEQRDRVLREFERLEDRARDSSGPALFALADRACRDALKEKALEYLEKAYDKDGEKLPKQIRVAEANSGLRLAIWCENTGRTDSAKTHCKKVIRLFADVPEKVAEAKELLERLSRPVLANYEATVRIETKTSGGGSRDEVAPEDEEATVVTQKVRSGSSKNEKLMAEVNRTFDEAMDHYVKGRPGNPNSNQHLHKAAALFDKVSALCEKALANDPGNSQIASRQADASRYAYHSRKMSTLSLF